jgi:hypothetical protein
MAQEIHPIQIHSHIYYFEIMLCVHVSLPSGRSETMQLPEVSTVADLQILAQES